MAEPPPVIDLDVTSGDDLAGLADRLGEHVDHLDGVVHAIGFAPEPCLGQDEGLFAASWDDGSQAHSRANKLAGNRSVESC